MGGKYSQKPRCHCSRELCSKDSKYTKSGIDKTVSIPAAVKKAKLKVFRIKLILASVMSLHNTLFTKALPCEQDTEGENNTKTEGRGFMII